MKTLLLGNPTSGDSRASEINATDRRKNKHTTDVPVRNGSGRGDEESAPCDKFLGF